MKLSFLYSMTGITVFTGVAVIMYAQSISKLEETPPPNAGASEDIDVPVLPSTPKPVISTHLLLTNKMTTLQELNKHQLTSLEKTYLKQGLDKFAELIPHVKAWDTQTSQDQIVLEQMIQIVEDLKPIESNHQTDIFQARHSQLSALVDAVPTTHRETLVTNFLHSTKQLIHDRQRVDMYSDRLMKQADALIDMVNTRIQKEVTPNLNKQS